MVKKRSIRPLVITLIFGTLGELLASVSLFLALAVTVRYSQGGSVFAVIFLGMLLMSAVCLIIECGHGLHRSYGWAVAFKRYRKVKAKTIEQLQASPRREPPTGAT